MGTTQEVSSATNIVVRPLPKEKGIGFTSNVQLDGVFARHYRYEQLGRFHNYHFTNENAEWPFQSDWSFSCVIDAFSPNLNKFLHVGHLRNLALAKSLSVINTRSQFVALLGASLGVNEDAKTALQYWLDFVDYKPTKYIDLEVAAKNPIDNDPDVSAGTGEYENCLVWNGAGKPVVIRRSDGTTTYAYHDLAFSKAVGVTHYLTGMEQTEHFANLGLSKCHLPMGLVLDPKTGKKMKSRDGNALSADAALQLIVDRLDKTPEPHKLAWNVLAWNFLHVSRATNVQFDVENWTGPEQPGLYISYTLARLHSALQDFFLTKPQQPNKEDYQPTDVELLGISNYYYYWINQARLNFDPAGLANYCHDLARHIGNAYHSEKIVGGRYAFCYSLCFAYAVLKRCMENLAMFPLKEV